MNVFYVVAVSIIRSCDRTCDFLIRNYIFVLLPPASLDIPVCNALGVSHVVDGKSTCVLRDYEHPIALASECDAMVAPYLCAATDRCVIDVQHQVLQSAHGFSMSDWG